MAINDSKKEYSDFIQQIRNDIDSLIHEIEGQTIHNETLRHYSMDLAMDSVPLIRFLKEARKQADISLSLYAQ
jgi:uncharacterized protein (DUF2461 family)